MPRIAEYILSALEASRERKYFLRQFLHPIRASQWDRGGRNGRWHEAHSEQAREIHVQRNGMGLHWLLARVSPVWAGGLLLMGIGSRGPIAHIYDRLVGRKRVRRPPKPPGSLFNQYISVHPDV